MACDLWNGKLDTYLDNELSGPEMLAFDAHLRACASCAAEAFTRLQMKRAVQAAGRRFVPTDEFRRKVSKTITYRSRRGLHTRWIAAVAAVVVLMVGGISSSYLTARSERDRVFSEVADLHVATLASSSPVDVVSTDRHTVKPWFQGKIPFAFDLPELHDTGFTLLGGRVAYLDQTPGAQLIYDVGKHHMSVFIFHGPTLHTNLSGRIFSPKESPFRTESWSQGGLRYFVVGDASVADIDGLARLFRAE